SVFGLWGKFMRKASKGYRPHKAEARQTMEELQGEFQSVDRHKSRENAFMVFKDRIVIISNGEERVIDKNELSSCSMIKSRAGIFLAFYTKQNERIPIHTLLPAFDAYIIKKYLGVKLEEIKTPKNSENDTEPKRSRLKSIGSRVETDCLLPSAIFIFIGIVLIIFGYFHAMGDMPAIVGGFPLGIGLLVLVLAFRRYEFVHIFLLKITVAALFIFMGFLFLLIIEEAVTQSPVTASSLLRHPTVYGIVSLFFVSVGISFIPRTIRELIWYIKYR
ncbi:MAG: hypothetical protein K2N74_05355, partial [Clostridiales bacterium]|nr:hypothetical protein [Clostridiales bacterium]